MNSSRIDKTFASKVAKVSTSKAEHTRSDGPQLSPVITPAYDEDNDGTSRRKLKQIDWQTVSHGPIAFDEPQVSGYISMIIVYV